jgi:hypothetical protein
VDILYKYVLWNFRIASALTFICCRYNKSRSFIGLTSWPEEEEETNFMEQSPSWEANSCTASQDIPCLLWKPKVHYRVENSQPLAPILSQMHAVHTFPPYFPKIHSNIVLHFMLRSSKRSPTFGFLTKILYAIFIFTMRLHAPPLSSSLILSP